MEEARYWMWAKTKPELSPRVGSYGDSWEEQAFAEDAARALGGCVWPPRSYSCSFCRRDFRSAQALGGHMNVHRRDRARLKQSPNPTASEVVPHALSTCTSPPLCSFLFTNPNPNPNPNNFPDSPLAGVIRVRVSSPPPPFLPRVEEKEREKKTFRLFASPNVERGGKTPSWSSFLSEKRDRGDEEVASCKRRRVDEEEEEEEERKKPSLGFVQKMIGVERCLPQTGGAGDELDLELRLGDAPKVK